jgi:alkylated DNA repair dioxygenase AlkB
MAQRALFGFEEPEFDPDFSLERTDLEHGAWVELSRGFLRGHERLFEELVHGLKWRADERKMYDRVVDVPRLYCVLPSKHRFPVIDRIRAALDARYGTSFERVSLAYYRDGRDSVAWHGDYVARRMDQALVATVSLGAPRKFLLRETGGGPSIPFSIGMGDLIVMGGSCQRTYQHAIPKVARANPRIALMFRPKWRDDGTDTAERNDR